MNLVIEILVPHMCLPLQILNQSKNLHKLESLTSETQSTLLLDVVFSVETETLY
jgi:hypothetical protein